MDSTGHHAHPEDWGWAWVAVCSDCDWFSDGYPGRKDLAERDAAMHGRNEDHPWYPAGPVVPWEERLGNPFPGSKVPIQRRDSKGSNGP